MTREQYEAWRNAPENAPFFKFLKDKREDLKEAWATGSELDEYSHSIALIYGDVLNLDWERDIASFYGIEAKEKAEDDDE